MVSDPFAEVVHDYVESPVIEASPIDVVDAPVVDLIDTTEAASIVGVTVNYLRQFVFAKKLTVIERRGRKTYFNRADVMTFAATRKGS